MSNYRGVFAVWSVCIKIMVNMVEWGMQFLFLFDFFMEGAKSTISTSYHHKGKQKYYSKGYKETKLIYLRGLLTIGLRISIQAQYRFLHHSNLFAFNSDCRHLMGLLLAKSWCHTSTCCTWCAYRTHYDHAYNNNKCMTSFSNFILKIFLRATKP